MRPRFSRIQTKGQARHWRERGEGLSRRLDGRNMIHECVCILVLDTCLRRRNLTMIEERPFLRRWLQLCEPGILYYLRDIEERNEWRDLKMKIHTVAARSSFMFPEKRQLHLERQLFIGAVLKEIDAIGRYIEKNPGMDFTPEPDPAPESDKEGAGSGEAGGGAAGQAGGANAAPRPSPADPGDFIPLSEDELAAILDAAEDDNAAGPHMGAML